MDSKNNKIKDRFGRIHNYLRISLTEKCNLRCTYCMPSEGVDLTPRDELMNTDEVFEIAKTFVDLGVNKIRLTGGEPLVRKDFQKVLFQLSQLDVELSISTNGVLIDRFLNDFKKTGLSKINISLDSLEPKKFKSITRYDQLKKVLQNIDLALNEGFELKINVVLMKGFNEDEIIELIDFAKNRPLSIRFIEFMPFDGNAWSKSKVVTEQEILDVCVNHYGQKSIEPLPVSPNSTSHDFKVKSHVGNFGIISTVSNPFCDSCNRIRLTANGKIKNCLFSQGEMDLLTPLRQKIEINSLILKNLSEKHGSRGGLDLNNSFNNPVSHVNRSMIMIGG